MSTTLLLCPYLQTEVGEVKLRVWGGAEVEVRPLTLAVRSVREASQRAGVIISHPAAQAINQSQ